MQYMILNADTELQAIVVAAERYIKGSSHRIERLILNGDWWEVHTSTGLVCQLRYMDFDWKVKASPWDIEVIGVGLLQGDSS